MKKIFSIVLCMMLSGNLLAKEFNIDGAIKKCQKCHGINFDKSVLNASKNISILSKEEILQSFEQYINSEGIGRKRLMKIILKKYTPEQRDLIVQKILKTKKDNSKKEK